MRSVFAFCCFLLLTSGPRSVLGHGAPTDGQPPVPEGAIGANPVSTVDDPPEVWWDVLAGLDFRSGELNPELEVFIGQEVKIPGFMVPLEDFAREVSEFLLVPYVGACIHMPPPPPNQLVYVKMKDDTRVRNPLWDPIWIYGTLELEETTNMYGSVSFKLSGTEAKPYER